MDFSLTTLFVLPNGNLVADGFKRENLQPTQFGVFNSRYKAVTTANEAAKSPHIVFGQGRIENLPGLTHKYSDKISRGSLIEWYKTTGSPVAKSQITYAGFDGIDSTKTMKVGCDEQYSLTVRARSLYIDTAFAYGLTRTVTVTTPCCADCGNDCETVDPRILANAFAEKINAEPLLSKFVVASPVFECQTPPDAPTVVDVITYCVSFCDNGDASALADVQGQYTGVVSLKERVGSISTYEITQLASDPAPANVLVSQPVKLAVCSTCPSGYTLQDEQESYIVDRILQVGDDVNSAVDQQTFANAVKAAYVAPEVFNGATGVDDAAETITVTGHGYVAGEAVVYSNGGGTSIGGLTSGNTYYVIVVDANTVKLATTKALALAGTAINLTDGVGAAHSLTPQSSATFLENAGGVAKILIKVSKFHPTLTAINSDVVTQLDNVEAICLPPAGASVAWAACGTSFKVQRTLKLTLADDCASDLAAVQAAYPGATITLEDSANCNSQYQMTQLSESVHETCNFATVPVFGAIQPYKGIEWTVVPEALTGATCVAGVKIEGKPLDKYGNPCDPIAFPHEFDKLTFEVFAYKGAATSQDSTDVFNRCDNIPVTTTQKSTFATGSGEEIFMLEKRFNSNQSTSVGKHIYHNATWNGGFVRYSQPHLFYDTYVLKFASPDLNTWDNVSRQDESVIIVVPSGTGASLEAFLIGYFGVEKFTAGVLIQSV